MKKKRKACSSQLLQMTSPWAFVTIEHSYCVRAEWNNDKESRLNNPHNIVSYHPTESPTHCCPSSGSNSYCCSSSWMNQIEVTVWDVTSCLKSSGSDYSAVCCGLIESRGRVQRFRSGLGQSGVKLNVKETRPKTVQSVWCWLWWISE